MDNPGTLTRQEAAGLPTGGVAGWRSGRTLTRCIGRVSHRVGTLIHERLRQNPLGVVEAIRLDLDVDLERRTDSVQLLVCRDPDLIWLFATLGSRVGQFLKRPQQEDRNLRRARTQPVPGSNSALIVRTGDRATPLDIAYRIAGTGGRAPASSRTRRAARLSYCADPVAKSRARWQCLEK